MKLRQRYLAWIRSLSLLRLLIYFVVLYLGLAAVFSLVYWAGGLLEGTESLHALDYVYFSFITQCTVGYGDITPVSFGRAVVILHTMLSLLMFAIGTGIAIVRVLTPEKNAILFADYIVRGSIL